MAHLASALAYHKLPLRDALEAQQEQLEELRWKLDQAAILNGPKLQFDLDVYRAPIPTLLTKLGADHGDTRALKAAMNASWTGLRAAIQVLERVGVRGSQVLPYTYQLLILAEALRQLNLGETTPVDVAKRAEDRMAKPAAHRSHTRHDGHRAHRGRWRPRGNRESSHDGLLPVGNLLRRLHRLRRSRALVRTRLASTACVRAPHSPKESPRPAPREFPGHRTP